MTVSTYYIKTASSAEFWVNKTFAVDGLTTTYMYNSDSFPRVAYLHDTQAPNNLTDVIESMRVRFFVTSAGTLAFDVTETAAWDNNRINEDGSDTFVTASAAWTDWYDLVVTPRGGNTWFLLSEYYAKVVGNEQNIDHVYKIELEVTHEPQPAAGPQLMGYGRNDSDGVNVTTLTAYCPGRFDDGVQAKEGDLVLLVGMSDADGADGNMLSIAGGSGYAKLGESGDGVADAACAVFWKIMGVGETTAFAIDSTDSDEMVTMGIVVNAGTFDPDNPINDWSIKSATGTSIYINESAGDDCTTTVDNCLLIGLMATDGSDKLPVTGGTSVGTVLEQAIVEDGGNDVGGFLEYKYQATAGAVGDWIRTCQNNDGAATFCIAIAPATGAPAPPPLMSLPYKAMRHMIIR